MPKTHGPCSVSWSLLQLQPAYQLSVQFDTAKCDHAQPANTQAASQAGDSVSETVWNMHDVFAFAVQTWLIILITIHNTNILLN